jgi:hypothetical protein
MLFDLWPVVKHRPEVKQTGITKAMLQLDTGALKEMLALLGLTDCLTAAHVNMSGEGNGYLDFPKRWQAEDFIYRWGRVLAKKGVRAKLALPDRIYIDRKRTAKQAARSATAEKQMGAVAARVVQEAKRLAEIEEKIKAMRLRNYGRSLISTWRPRAKLWAAWTKRQDEEARSHLLVSSLRRAMGPYLARLTFKLWTRKRESMRTPPVGSGREALEPSTSTETPTRQERQDPLATAADTIAEGGTDPPEPPPMPVDADPGPPADEEDVVDIRTDAQEAERALRIRKRDARSPPSKGKRRASNE